VGAVAAARIGWIEVALLSLRIAGVSGSIGRGKIVDFGGCLGVGSVGWQVLAKEKAREFCLREPLVSMDLLRGPIVLVSLLVSVDNQN